MARSKDDDTKTLERPLDHPTPGVLTADEQGRLRELMARGDALDDKEREERDALQARNVPQAANVTDRVQRDLSPDRPPAPIAEMPKEQANRLRDLRVAADMGRLSDDERAEMGRLSLEESKAAGHPEPVEGDGNPYDDAWIIYELLALTEQIIGRTPAYRDLEIRARNLHDRLDGLRSEFTERRDALRDGTTDSKKAAA